MEESIAHREAKRVGIAQKVSRRSHLLCKRWPGVDGYDEEDPQQGIQEGRGHEVEDCTNHDATVHPSV